MIEQAGRRRAHRRRPSHLTARARRARMTTRSMVSDNRPRSRLCLRSNFLPETVALYHGAIQVKMPQTTTIDTCTWFLAAARAVRSQNLSSPFTGAAIPSCLLSSRVATLSLPSIHPLGHGASANPTLSPCFPPKQPERLRRRVQLAPGHHNLGRPRRPRLPPPDRCSLRRPALADDPQRPRPRPRPHHPRAI